MNSIQKRRFIRVVYDVELLKQLTEEQLYEFNNLLGVCMRLENSEEFGYVSGIYASPNFESVGESENIPDMSIFIEDNHVILKKI